MRCQTTVRLPPVYSFLLGVSTGSILSQLGVVPAVLLGALLAGTTPSWDRILPAGVSVCHTLCDVNGKNSKTRRVSARRHANKIHKPIGQLAQQTTVSTHTRATRREFQASKAAQTKRIARISMAPYTIALTVRRPDSSANYQ
eukprot:scaffold739_cov66-Cyclotella_meneghiniana.AAC.6